MRKISRFLGLLFFGIIILSSCSKKSMLSKSDADGKGMFELPVEDFNFLSTRSKIRFENGGTSMSGNGSVRIQKDSIIWISINAALGIEAVRILINRDGVSFMNRLERTYLQADYLTLSRALGFQLTYPILQESLLGNMPFAPNSNDKINPKGSGWEVKQQKADLTVNNVLIGSIMKLSELEAVQRGSQNALKMEFQRYEKVEELNIPFKSAVSLAYTNGGKKEKTKIELEHSRVEITQNPPGFPFSIPDRYSRIVL
jgi:hypothetical protein